MTNQGFDLTRGICCKIQEKRDGVFIVESTDKRLSEFVDKEHRSLAELYDAINKLADSYKCGLFVFLNITTERESNQ